MDNVIGKKVRIKDIVDVPIYLRQYDIKYCGRTGTIVAVTFSTSNKEDVIYTIEFREYDDLNITSNYFDFINEEENKNMAALTGYAAVAVIEQGCYNKEYYYAIYADGYNYKVGDKVLVSNNNDIWTIKRLLTVQQAAEERKAAITAEVVTHVDNSAYLKRVEQRKEAAAIKKDMDKIIKQMDEKMKYEIYAEENPELKKMLERYRELKGEWD